MCSNYRPATARAMLHFDVQAPLGLKASDVYPLAQAPLIVSENAKRVCRIGAFGLRPIWAKADFGRRTYNARSETAASKPSFREAWKNRQTCIVPADAIYEPNYESGEARWWRIWRADDLPLAIAGLFEHNAHGWSFTMLTTNADDNPVMRRFHKPKSEKRTPVFLEPTHYDAWLDTPTEEDVRALIASPASELLAAAGRIQT